VLKWILVCCFGYTGYRNARFGRIECHEAICAWSRDILLETIEEAELDGWECLHAIVDSVWVADTRGRNEEERAESISRLISRIEARIGIPLELEEVYEWIAFVPNRTTGVGALTKYFAYGREGWKVRGIELRQHSTCDWVRDLQESIMEILRQGLPGEAPMRGVEHLHYELARLRGGEIPLADLVVGRRVRNEAGNHRVLNLTAAALLRERGLGQRTPSGRKVRFAVVGWERPDAADRIRMESEVEARTPSISGQSGDCDFYEPLAIRAATALLAPFGWSEDGIRGGRSVQTSLAMWV
jgi:DNA polymerase I